MNFIHLMPHLAAISIKADDIGLPHSTPTVGAALSIVVNTLIFLIGMLSVVMIIVGGIKIVVSNGDPARYKSGRDTITYAVVGIILALIAYSVVIFIASNVK